MFEKKGESNMCKALNDLIKDGERKGKLELLLSLIDEGILSLQQAADKMNMSVASFKKATSKLATE